MKSINITLDDTITSINSKIKKIGETDELFLVVEEKGSVLEKLVNLKIIKKQLEKFGILGKIATNSRVLISVAESLDIEVFSIKDFENLVEKLRKNSSADFNQINSKKPIFIQKKSLSNELKIKKISIPSNSLEKSEDEIETSFDKTDLERTNFAKKSFAKKIEEVDENKKSSHFSTQTSLLKNLFNKLNSFFTRKNEVFQKKNRFIGKIIFGFLSISLIVFLFVMFVSYPRVNLTIMLDNHSQRSSLEFKISKNISFIDLNQKILPAFVESVNVSGEKEVATTNFDLSGEKSSGKVRMYNDLDTPQGLLDQTQLQAKSNGKIFRIQGPTTIPAKGSILVDVVADTLGDDGNIDPTDFIVVKLSPYLQSQVYGKSEQKFSGGVTIKTANVSANEINYAKDAYRKEFADAKTKEVIESLNKSTDKKFISGSEQVEISAIDDSVNVGDQVDSYKLSATGKVSVLGFKTSDLESLIFELAKRDLKEGEMLDTFEVSKLEIISKNGLIDAQIKAEITLFVISDLDKEELKNKISGKSRLDAIIILENTSGVRKVEEFTFSPSWFKTVPVSSSNIKIDFKKAPSMKLATENTEENV
ncbi:MAG: hypothetical protein Fur0024_1860 [Patescibacteria group bacterium]